MKILAFVGSHLAVVLVAGALVYLAVDRAHERSLRKKADEALQKVQTEAAKERGFQAVAPTSAGKTEAALSPEAKAELAAIRTKVENTSVAVHGLAQVLYARDSVGKAIPATDTTPPYCVDDFNMIRVDTKNCRFQLNLELLDETTVLRGTDGKTRLVKQTVRLLDPVTHLPVPGDPPKVTSDFRFTEEKAPERVFGLKLLGGVDERFAPGGGIQFAEKWRVSARALGFYSPKDQDLRGLIALGWRPRVPFFDSRVAVGAGVGLSTKTPGMIFGAHLTAELGTVTK